MKCSYMTRCNDPKITYFDDIYNQKLLPLFA